LGDIKGYLKHYSDHIEKWLVSSAAEIVDQFRRLTTIFEVCSEYFFSRLADASTSFTDHSYLEMWRSKVDRISVPQVEYSELSAIGKVIEKLPEKCYLHVANSAPARMVHLFKINNSVEVFCNRGVNGIDGCMSTAVGFA